MFLNKKEEYSEVEQRIENIKLKYQAIRDQKIREENRTTWHRSF